jgi:L-asparaginase II
VTVVGEVVRSGFVESRHHGSLVALAPDGKTQLLSVGDVDSPMFPRSSNKPMQASAVVRLGVVEAFGLEDRHIALASASHSGEPMHVTVVRDLLARADVPESALACPYDLPLDTESATAILARGGTPSRITHNCSGKHAAFLAACAAHGWPIEGYRDAGHPLQLHVRTVIEELADETVVVIGVDGCGAPIFGLSLIGLARAFGRIATAPAGSAEDVVAGAIRRQPVLFGGTGRDVTRLLQAVPGLVAKDGAEGVFAAALPDGTSIALKIDDGSFRPRTALMVAALRALGVTGDEAELAALESPEVLGGGSRVGEVRVPANLLKLT